MMTVMNTGKESLPAGAASDAALERATRFAETLLGPGLELPAPGLLGERRTLFISVTEEVHPHFPALRDLEPLLSWTILAERLRASVRLQRCLLRSALQGQFTQLPYSLERNYLPSVQLTQSPIWALLAAQKLHASVMQALIAAAGSSRKSDQSVQNEVLRLLGQAKQAKPQTLADVVVTAQISCALSDWMSRLSALALPRSPRLRLPLYPNLESQLGLLRACCPNFAALSPLAWPQLFAQPTDGVPALDSNALGLLVMQAGLRPIADWTASRLADRIEPRAPAAARGLGEAFEKLTPVIFPGGRESLPHPPGAVFLLGFYTKLLLAWRPRLDEHCRTVSGQEGSFTLLFRDLEYFLGGRDMLLARVASGPLNLAANRLRAFLDQGLDDDFTRVKTSYMQARVLGDSAGEEVL
jgi:hypothetical protein